MRHLNFQNPCMYSCLTHLLQQPWALSWLISSLNFTFSVWCTDLLRRQRETR